MQIAHSVGWVTGKVACEFNFVEMVLIEALSFWHKSVLEIIHVYRFGCNGMRCALESDGLDFERLGQVEREADSRLRATDGSASVVKYCLAELTEFWLLYDVDSLAKDQISPMSSGVLQPQLDSDFGGIRKVFRQYFNLDGESELRGYDSAADIDVHQCVDCLETDQRVHCLELQFVGAERIDEVLARQGEAR